MQPLKITWSTPALETAWKMAPLEALHRGHPFVGVEHVLIVLSRCEDGFTARMIARLGIEPQEFRARIRKVAGGPRIGHASESLPITPRLHRALTAALARREGQPLDEQTCLLALLSDDGGVFALLCEAQQDWSLETIRDAVAADSEPEATRFVEPAAVLAIFQAPPYLDLAAAQRADPADVGAYPDVAASGGRRRVASALDEFGRDLTAEARAGRLSEAYGRQDLLVRIAQVLAHDFANNPVLVGEAGVGKTAIVEGFAWRLAQSDRPIHPHYRLENTRIIEINVGRLTAGTEYRGAFEQRLQRIIDEASADPHVILFFDELHTLVGAGRAGSASALDAAQMLKPALARGTLRCIGATTAAEFDRFVAGDEALARRFERVDVPEPSSDLMFEILERWRPTYTQRYTVSLPDETLRAAIRLSVRYLPNRHLPEKAFKVLDNARVLATVGGAQLSLNFDVASPGAQPGINPAAPVVVTPEHIAKALTTMTGIPVSADATPQQALTQLPALLEGRVKGQPEAISRVAAAAQAAFAGLYDPQRPRAVMLFIGPTGVGKTELAATLADILFGTGQFLRLDMGEFGEAHTDARLIGSPPGYVGHEHGGELTDWLREHPHSLVLLDEVDKAHARIMDLLLGLLDAGRLTDGRGREVSGRDAIFILTANFPLRLASLSRPLGFVSSGRNSLSDQQIRAQLVEFIRAEFVSRIDEIVLFQSLPNSALQQIVQLRLDELADRARASQHVEVQFDDNVKQLVLDQALASGPGAREISSTIRRLVVPPLSQTLLLMGGGPANVVQVSVDGLTGDVTAMPAG